MSLTERFFAYAAAFEKAFVDDDWSVVEPFFAPDAVYVVPLGPPLGGRFEGREAILSYFKRVLDGFDRRFETRRIELTGGPRERDDAVWLAGRAIYTAPGVPDAVLELEETVGYDADGRILHLEDRYPDGAEARLGRYLAEHGARLGIGASVA